MLDVGSVKTNQILDLTNRNSLKNNVRQVLGVIDPTIKLARIT